MKCKTWVTCCLVFFFILILTIMCILLYKRLKLKGFSEQDEWENEELNEKDVLYKFQESPAVVSKINNITNMIKLINKYQHIYNYKDASGLKYNTTIMVIQVHNNITYLNVFLESLCKVLKIHESLLIFAHDNYDDEINAAIRSIRCAAGALQLFYPHSVQLHPNTYPGEDSRFCPDLVQCIDSRKRDPVLVQTKLFWWWATNQVFDYIKVSKHYNGYIYFLETNQYLTSDFIYMAKMLERHQPKLCSKCKILSLGAGPPRPDMYYPEHSSLVIKIWGCSNYSNSGIGFNRTTWDEIKSLSPAFCFFKDSSWEYSLKYLASKTSHKRFFMLSTEGPRFFPTTGCGAFKNGTDCDLTSNHHDILKFIVKIQHGRLPRKFKLKYDVNEKPNVVDPRGGWEDARDIDLCMCFLSKNETRILSKSTSGPLIGTAEPGNFNMGETGIPGTAMLKFPGTETLAAKGRGTRNGGSG